MVYVALGDDDKANDWLDAAYRVKDSWLTELAVDPGFDSLRDTPRFQQLVTRMGLR